MAPRKIIDMDIVSTEALDTALPTVQKDSRKTKQLLLEIERVCSISKLLSLPLYAKELLNNCIAIQLSFLFPTLNKRFFVVYEKLLKSLFKYFEFIFNKFLALNVHKPLMIFYYSYICYYCK